ncbi:hypothetical protein T36_0647 [Helicobacter cinaedi]|uniref:hypothetical protein n=1 Tax=Helicobacter cinaedi TaxID=213 RepID=UPI001F35ADC0|nr:hypothetical protein [Helicobacter cinaedi]BDB64200.1 hypothetical protein T36_0647 [Helicobacter cinaedi]
MTFWYVCENCGYINEVDSAEIDLKIKLDSEVPILSICSECGESQSIVIEVIGEKRC